jgi:hypothetical protein
MLSFPFSFTFQFGMFCFSEPSLSFHFRAN